MSVYQKTDPRNKVVVLRDDTGDQLTLPAEQLAGYDGVAAEGDPPDERVWTEHRSLAEWLDRCFVPRRFHRMAVAGTRPGPN